MGRTMTVEPWPLMSHHGEEEDASSASDCESGTTTHNASATSDGLVRMPRDDKVFRIVETAFLSGLGSLRQFTSVVDVRRNGYRSFTSRARLESFRVFGRAVEMKHGGNANVRFAWYSAASKEEVSRIFSHGFTHADGLYGSGVYLYHHHSAIESVNSCVADDEGLRHLLLCRVILGKMEVVRAGSQQNHPSSEDLDSGVDNLSSPKRYIVWSTHMNTHILPEYAVTFRAPPSLIGFLDAQEPSKKPNSPWMPFSTLISVLAKFLPSHSVGLIAKHHRDHRENKIPRHELIRLVREIAGDKLLTAIIRSHRAKQLRSIHSCQRRRTQNGTSNRMEDAVAAAAAVCRNQPGRDDEPIFLG